MTFYPSSVNYNVNPTSGTTPAIAQWPVMSYHLELNGADLDAAIAAMDAGFAAMAAAFEVEFPGTTWEATRVLNGSEGSTVIY